MSDKGQERWFAVNVRYRAARCVNEGPLRVIGVNSPSTNELPRGVDTSCRANDRNGVSSTDGATRKHFWNDGSSGSSP